MKRSPKMSGLHETETEGEFSQINQTTDELDSAVLRVVTIILMERTTPPRKKVMSSYVHNNFFNEQASSQRNKLVSFPSPPRSRLGTNKHTWLTEGEVGAAPEHFSTLAKSLDRVWNGLGWLPPEVRGTCSC